MARHIALIAALALIVAACGDATQDGGAVTTVGGSGLGTGAASPTTKPSPASTTTPVTASPGTTAAAGGDDLRWVEGGSLGTGGSLLVPIEPGDISFLAFARTADRESQVFVTAVIAPDGSDVGDRLGVEYGEFSNFAEAAFYLPIRDSVPLLAGEYRVDFEATSPIVSSGAVVRSGDAEGPQAIDVVFWMATTVEYDREALERRFRDVGDVVLARHGITVGDMTFLDPPPDVVERYSVIEFSDPGDSELRSLCREMSAHLGDARAIQVAIVDHLDDGDPDGVIEGSSSGLPGTAMLTGSDLSCVAGMAAHDPEFDRDLFDRAVVIWHEAAHHLGLFHTSEGDGLFFDLIDDTPECRIEERDDNGDGWIDVSECGGLDADNFMFFDGDGTDMTADQAWMIRRHPLLYPTG